MAYWFFVLAGANLLVGLGLGALWWRRRWRRTPLQVFVGLLALAALGRFWALFHPGALVLESILHAALIPPLVALLDRERRAVAGRARRRARPLGLVGPPPLSDGLGRIAPRG